MNLLLTLFCVLYHSCHVGLWMNWLPPNCANPSLGNTSKKIMFVICRIRRKFNIISFISRMHSHNKYLVRFDQVCPILWIRNVN